MWITWGLRKLTEQAAIVNETNRLPDFSANVTLSPVITKLAATQANGGAGITFSADAPGSARVSINGEGFSRPVRWSQKPVRSPGKHKTIAYTLPTPTGCLHATSFKLQTSSDLLIPSPFPQSWP